MIKNITKEEAKVIVQDILSKSFQRFRQELCGENEEFLDRLVRDYRSKISKLSWKTAQKWCKWSDEGPVLMPDCTRIYYKKGNTEVLLQEFQPQTRILKFHGSLSCKEKQSDVIDNNDIKNIYNFTLSLPYVIFLFKFIDGMFSEVRCAFADRPLKNLQEKPYRPFLSNIDSNLSICLGSSFNKDLLIKNDLTQQCALVLDHFWNASFSDEWSSHYWAYVSWFLENDKRLSNLKSWQSNTLDDPFFVIEDVSWLEYSEDNFGDIIVKMFENDYLNNNLNEEIYNNIIDNFLNEVIKIFDENTKDVESNITHNLLEKMSDMLLNSINK